MSQEVPPPDDKDAKTTIPAPGEGVKSSEFVTTITVVATNLIAVAAIVFKWTPEQATDVTNSVIAVIGAFTVLVTNGLVAWRYLESRKSIKTEVIKAEASIIKNRDTAHASAETEVRKQQIISDSVILGAKKEERPPGSRRAGDPEPSKPAGGERGIPPRI